jgi:hypothetical protein
VSGLLMRPLPTPLARMEFEVGSTSLIRAQGASEVAGYPDPSHRLLRHTSC